MKKVLWINLLFILSGFTTEKEYVYICTGPKAKVYHATTKCKGLNKCSASIKKVSLDDIKSSRRACKLCY